VAAFAYVLLPLSGMLAYFLGSTARVRFHGLQAIILGVAWPLALYGSSRLSAGATQLAFVVGVAVWLAFLLLTLIGKEPRLPGLGRWLARASEG
jgi:uncharacterized membrane protein